MTIDPKISEWDNLTVRRTVTLAKVRELTEGTETS